MQTKKTEREETIARSGRFNKRIGSTIYEVEVSFNPEAREGITEKVGRMITNDLLTNAGGCGTMELLQADALSGGSRC
jgi:hypothetical protein